MVKSLIQPLIVIHPLLVLRQCLGGLGPDQGLFG